MVLVIPLLGKFKALEPTSNFVDVQKYTEMPSKSTFLVHSYRD